MLNELAGLREHVWLEVGPHRVRAEVLAGRGDDDPLAAVEYLKFRLGPAVVAALRAGSPAAVASDHPRYGHRAPLAEATRRALLDDLADAPAAA